VRPAERTLAAVESRTNGRGVIEGLGSSASFNLTDLGNSERFIAEHGEDVLYCYAWSRWLVWSGARWERDDGGKVHRLAKATVRNIYREAAAAEDEKERKALAAHAKSSEAEARIRAMLELAKSEVPVFSEQLDARPWFLNVQNGTIDLRRGALRPHHREDLITKLAPVEYRQDAEAPRFLRYLAEVFAGDEQLIAFVRRFAGYSLTGSTEERVFAILHGTGKNGKTTLVELLRDVLGDYAANTSAETILSQRNEGINNDVAALKGARFVSAAEVEQDRRLAESKVKNLTGTDTVTARFLYSEPFEFRPEFKLWLSTNNKPVIRGTDDAIWDRIRLIPFEQRFAGGRGDPKLPGKLREERARAWGIPRRSGPPPRAIAPSRTSWRPSSRSAVWWGRGRGLSSPTFTLPTRSGARRQGRRPRPSGDSEVASRTAGSSPAGAPAMHLSGAASGSLTTAIRAQRGELG
jgi:putative DNA primase/helicase